MRAVKILQQILGSSLSLIHANRVKSVFWCVFSLVYGSRLSLTGIGRSAKGSTLTKHNIKRVDRLLGNIKLHKETHIFYRAIAAMVIAGKKHPVVIVDWTGAGRKHFALVAAVPIDGRAIPVHIQVYSSKLNNNPTVEKRFLKKLKSILPSGCSPIIVTDAGFKNPWFRAVNKMGWDFVGRVMSTAHACPIEGNKWCPTQSLFAKAIYSAKDLGQWLIAKSNSLKVRLVLIKSRPTGRKSRYSKAKTIIEARVRSRKPWLLATSLSSCTPKKVINFYSLRFQIEESFRDAKNTRFGWSFNHARSRKKQRIEILLLIATLAMLSLTIIGITAERLGISKGFQANTEKSKRVLSLFFLGKNIVQKETDRQFLTRDYCLSIQFLNGKVTCL